MADPGFENGYLRIPNKIYEALARMRIPGQTRQVMDFIIRKTWGYKKREDMISLSQFAEGTGLIKSKVIKAREKLIQMNLISIVPNGNNRMPLYRFNEDFDTWKPLPKKGMLSKKQEVLIKKGQGSLLPEKIHVKEEDTKGVMTNVKLQMTKDKDQSDLKKRYMDFVLLTKEEYRKLRDIFGKGRALEWIEDLNIYIGKKGEAWINRNYRSHYFMIMSWSKEERRRMRAEKEAEKREEEERQRFIRDRERLKYEMEKEGAKPVGEIAKVLTQATEKKKALKSSTPVKKGNMEISIETIRECLNGGMEEEMISDILRRRGYSDEKIDKILTEAHNI